MSQLYPQGITSDSSADSSASSNAYNIFDESPLIRFAVTGPQAKLIRGVQLSYVDLGDGLGAFSTRIFGRCIIVAGQNAEDLRPWEPVTQGRVIWDQIIPETGAFEFLFPKEVVDGSAIVGAGEQLTAMLLYPAADLAGCQFGGSLNVLFESRDNAIGKLR